MAVAVRGFTIIVPIHSIDLYYPHGFNTWLMDTFAMGGKKNIWYDNILVAMSYYDPEHAGNAIHSWCKEGFVTILDGGDPQYSLLVTQVDEILGLQFDHCDWLNFDAAIPCVWPTWTNRGEVVTEESFKR